MAEQLTIPKTDDRQAIYTALLPQIEALVAPESDPVANMANVAAVLRAAFGFFWVGFYRVIGHELVLGPFQGAVACSRIGYGKGVCGTAWEKASTQIVADVDAFPGHIACSSDSRSEIVVPLFTPSSDQVVGVLDIDSDRLDDFSEIDAVNLENLLKKIGNRLQ
ncbi:GAF domain-containing protein [uncultured Rikenella sp.]|uniref:GAF domain-containing protein n=1 Tax=uncultured Rikenella sp. TaxID=368003 RepID=UPI0025EF4ABB|nr:GAF domain-containing protein [uncultured Rikenella sp.]